MEPIDPSQPTEASNENHELITLGSFNSLNEALLAKGLLESCGIECFLADDNMARMETSFAFNIRLQVKPEDAETATKILAGAPADEPENKVDERS